MNIPCPTLALGMQGGKEGGGGVWRVTPTTEPTEMVVSPPLSSLRYGGNTQGRSQKLGTNLKKKDQNKKKGTKLKKKEQNSRSKVQCSRLRRVGGSCPPVAAPGIFTSLKSVKYLKR